MNIKKLIPKKLFTKIQPAYHYSLAVLGAILYRFPSEKMIVIGVTGTKGKTSAINFIWSALTTGGFKTGIISTANIRIGEKEFLNKFHMTMPGRFVIQKFMREMVKAGCKYCIVETTSEGIKQFRHIGINYDIAVFTNLSPEHLTSHGGNFENYKKAKGKLFAKLSKLKKKKINGEVVEKISIANTDSEHAEFFLTFPADKKITFGINDKADLVATDIKEDSSKVSFKVLDSDFELSISGKFNIYNALPAIAIARLAKINDKTTTKGLRELTIIPGRMERINEGQNFTMIVDYAHEKESMTNVLNTAQIIKQEGGKVIVLLGAEGGGRDKTKRPLMGEISAKLADYVVVSNVDPYDDDPKEILEDIAVISEKFGKKRNENLFVIEDRREGIKKAIELAKEKDVVLITGKGAEQSMIIKGNKIPWDDRKVVREELKKYSV